MLDPRTTPTNFFLKKVDAAIGTIKLIIKTLFNNNIKKII